MRQKNKIFLLLILVVSLWPGGSSAATLSLQSNLSTITVGQTFSIKIYVASSDRAVNALQGKLNFSTSHLSFLGFDKANSLINLWVQEPVTDKLAGTLQFEGIVLNPGYAGARGQILTANFKALAPGVARFSLAEAAVLANDGAGTNVLTEATGLDVNVLPAVSFLPVNEESLPSLPPPSALTITSPTHPDEDSWYAINKPILRFELPEQARAVRLLYDKHQNSIPSVNYVPAIAEKELPELKDGVWYFHAEVKNSGGWSPVTHFRLNIDTERPESLTVTALQTATPSDPRFTFQLTATDRLSGLDKYEVVVDYQPDKVTLPAASSTTFITPFLPAGPHQLIVTAFDRAGNHLIESVPFVTPELEAPTIAHYTKNVTGPQDFLVEGETYPQAEVTTSLIRQADGSLVGEWLSAADPVGHFAVKASFGYFTLANGAYQLQAQAKLINGTGGPTLQTPRSQSYAVEVEWSWWNRLILWWREVAFPSSVFKILWPLFILFVLLLLLLFLGLAWRRKKTTSRRRLPPTGDLAVVLQLLADDLRSQVALLENAKAGRPLTPEEVKIWRRLKADLTDTELLIGRKKLN